MITKSMAGFDLYSHGQHVAGPVLDRESAEAFSQSPVGKARLRVLREEEEEAGSRVVCVDGGRYLFPLGAPEIVAFDQVGLTGSATAQWGVGGALTLAQQGITLWYSDYQTTGSGWIALAPVSAATGTQTFVWDGVDSGAGVTVEFRIRGYNGSFGPYAQATFLSV